VKKFSDSKVVLIMPQLLVFCVR